MRGGTGPGGRAIALAAVLLVVGAGAMPGAAAVPATVAAEGDVMGFGPYPAPVSGLTVSVLEHPGLTATTDAGGHWRIDGIPAGSTATFSVTGPDRFPIRTATLPVGEQDLSRVTFQSPSTAMVGLLEDLLDTPTRPDRCHIASTVTRRGFSLYGGAADGTHGEPGATVTIDPVPAAGGRPIYFNGTQFDLIWPDPQLDATTPDGGVLFVNVTPGTYTLRAHKHGAEILSVEVGCWPGVLTNASPPWGLQVTSGGLEPDETVPFPTQTTTTTSTTSTTVAPPPPTSAPAAPPAEAVDAPASFTG